MIDEFDLIITIVLISLLVFLSSLLCIHYTDKEICKLKNGVLVGGECISVEAVKQ